MILLRTTELAEWTQDFASELETASGMPVAFLVDERRKQVDTTRLKVGLTEPACKSLNLACPPDFAWRCGDYGLYLARRAFPEVQRFWLVEYDIRFSPGAMRGLFDFFAAHTGIDLLGVDYRPADSSWFWRVAVESRDATPYRCFFPLLRISARAIDVLLAKRVAQSRQPHRRVLWPNDESFVATTLANTALICRDFNDFGRTFYDKETFSYMNLINGDEFQPPQDEMRVYHPVAFGSDYRKKAERLAQRAAPQSFSERLRVSVARRVNRLTKW